MRGWLCPGDPADHTDRRAELLCVAMNTLRLITGLAPRCLRLSCCMPGLFPHSMQAGWGGGRRGSQPGGLPGILSSQLPAVTFPRDASLGRGRDAQPCAAPEGRLRPGLHSLTLPYSWAFFSCLTFYGGKFQTFPNTEKMIERTQLQQLSILSQSCSIWALDHGTFTIQCINISVCIPSRKKVPKTATGALSF